MPNEEISEQLLRIVSADDFGNSSAESTDAWSAAAVGAESIDAVLEFMEAHPNLDYGVPGALVHFVEDFHQKGYEEKLLNSINRSSTILTVGMLNRVINGAQEPDKKAILVSTMKHAAGNPKTDRQTLDCVNGFLERLKS
jgi:hypothetical protein